MRFVPSYSLRTPSYSSGEFYVPSRLIDEGLYHTVKLPHIDSLYHDLCADADLLRNAPTVDGDDILGTAASVDGDGADEIDRRRSSSSKGTNNTRRPISIARSTSNGVDTSSMPLHVNSSRARIPRHLKRRKSQGFRKLWFLGRGRTKEFVEDSAHGGEGKSCDVDHPQSSNVPVVSAHIVESSPIDSELLSVFNVDQRAAAVGRIRARIAGHVSLLVQEAYTRWVEDKEAARQRSVEEASTATITQVGAEESGKHASDAISLHVDNVENEVGGSYYSGDEGNNRWFKPPAPHRRPAGAKLERSSSGDIYTSLSKRALLRRGKAGEGGDDSGHGGAGEGKEEGLTPVDEGEERWQDSDFMFRFRTTQMCEVLYE